MANHIQKLFQGASVFVFTLMLSFSLIPADLMADELGEYDVDFLTTPDAQRGDVITYSSGIDDKPLQLQAKETNLSFDPKQIVPFEVFADDGPSSAVSADRIVFEEPGVIQVVEGSACADSLDRDAVDNDQVAALLDPFNDEGRIISIRGLAELPDYATHATVILNGWRLLYLDKNEICDSQDPNSPCYAWQENPVSVDHHVDIIDAHIINTFYTRLKSGDILTWDTRGQLADDNGDDPFGFCYRYTVVAWNDEVIDADFLHGDPLDSASDGLEHESHAFRHLASGLVRDKRSLSPSPFLPSDSVALVPRGTRYRWDCFDPDFNLAVEFCPGVDRHLQQLAYKYEQDLGRLSGQVDWETFAIYRDKEPHHDFVHSEYLSVIGGADVDILHPDFNLAPQEDSGADGCVSLLPGFKVVEYEIPNIPYDFAVPVLSGWDLTYPCDDDVHVADIGAWLFDIDYVKSEEAPTGTLRYKVATVFRDNDPNATHRGRTRVSILGLNAPRWITGPVRFNNGIVNFASQIPDVRGFIQNVTGSKEFIQQASFGGPQSNEFGSYELIYRGGTLPIQSLAQQPLELLPGETLYLSARFLPQAPALPGSTPRTAWVDFTTSSSRVPNARVPLEGYTQPITAMGSVFPTQYNFGLVELPLGNLPANVVTKTALLTSTGQTPLLIQSMDFADPNLGFGYVIQLYPQPPSNQIGQALYQMDPGEAMLIELRFSPQQVGTVQTRFVVQTNAGPLTFDVQGTGCSREAGCGS